MLLLAALENATRILGDAQVASPSVDSDLLMCHVLGISRGQLQTMVVLNSTIEDSEFDSFAALVRLREKRIPLQHITGVAPFRDFELRVGKGVFIPRPETESVVQFGIDYLNSLGGSSRAIDLGSGSGAIAISLAREVPEASVVAVELSVAAAKFTANNISNLAPDVKLIIGSMLELDYSHDGIYDLVISNPPYIPLTAVPKDREVRDHDPELALYGGTDGLDIVRELVGIGSRLLKKGGLLVLEHADGQSKMVCQLLLQGGYKFVEPHIDLAGRYRTVTAIF